MKALLTRLPLPITAVGLSFIGLAGLTSQLRLLSYLLAVTGSLVLLLIVLKIVSNWQRFLSQMKEVPLAATFPTFSMGLILLTKLVMPHNPSIATFLWYFGIGLHLLVMGYFTYQFVAKKELALVLPAWFVVYVGIVTASMTAPLLEQFFFGKVCFWFGFSAFILLFPLIIQRLKRLPLPLSLKPTLAILAAPASLNLTGYLSVYQDKQLWFVLLQLIVSQGLYFYILTKLPQLLTLSFHPSQGALTFPLVISTTALTLSGGFISQLMPTTALLFKWFIIGELAIALGVTFLVFSRYLQFIRPKKRD